VASPTVSIITPTRNRSQFARPVFACIAQQDYEKLEWLVADDSPEPNPFLSSLSDERVKYFYLSTPMTIGAKRNLLAERARGEIIVQFDDDDYYAPGYVARSVAELEKLAADMVKLSGFYIYSAIYDRFGYWDLTRKVGRHFVWSRSAPGEFFATDQTNGWLAQNQLGYGFSYVFTKDVWRSIQFSDRNWGEDGPFAVAVNQRFRLSIRADTCGDCLHILHQHNMSKCFPQYELPRSALDLIFPKAQPYLHLCYGSHS